MPSETTHNTKPLPAGLEFYHVPPARISGLEASIEDDEFAHLTRVMRHAEGDMIGIVDGAGMAYLATITSIRKHGALCSLGDAYPRLGEPSRQLTLAVAILKNPSRFETMVEKATELGVHAIIPLISTRTVPRHARVDRWHTIALSAMKQCGRCVIPEISRPTTLHDMLSTGMGQKILLHEQGTTPLEHCIGDDTQAHVTVCVGPEGGFTDAEVGSARDREWSVAVLGDRRLRSETAAITAAARMLT